MITRSFRIFCTLAFLFLFAGSATFASQTPSSSPSITDIVDAANKFDDEKSQITNSIASLSETKSFETSFEKLKDSFKSLKEQFSDKQSRASWNSLKITNFLNQSLALLNKSENQKKQYAKFFKSSDAIQQLLEKKRVYFSESKKNTRQTNFSPISISYVDSVLKEIKELQGQIKQRQEEVGRVYKNFEPLDTKIESLHSRFKSLSSDFKGSLFEKSKPEFVLGEFWAALKVDFHENFNPTLETIIPQDFKFLTDSLAFYVLAFFIFGLALAFLDRLPAIEGAHLPKKSTASFILVLALLYLIPNPPALIALSCWVVMPVLLINLVRNIRSFTDTSAYLFPLFTAYSLVRIIEIIDVPLTIYRLFVVSLCFALVTYIALRYRLERGTTSLSQTNRFFLMATVLVFVAATLSEILGYHRFAIYLVHGIVQTIFTLFTLIIGRNLAVSFLRRLLYLQSAQKLKLVQHYHTKIVSQSKNLISALAVFLTSLILPTLWGLSVDLEDSYNTLSSLGFTLGEKSISVGMILQALVLFGLTYTVAFILCSVLEDEVYPRKQIERGVANSINSLVRYFLWIAGVLIAFFALGFELQQLAIIAGALSVGIGFGLQNIINNFVSGIILLFERPVKIGDILEVGSVWGEVEKIGLRSTVIRTFAKTQLIIPNSDFVTQPVTNITFSDSQYRIVIPIGIAYGSNTDLAKDVMLEVLESQDKVLKNPAPKVFFRGFGNSSLDFELFLWIPNALDKLQVISDILFDIDNKFRAQGIEIPFPQQDLHLRSIDGQALASLKDDSK